MRDHRKLVAVAAAALAALLAPAGPAAADAPEAIRKAATEVEAGNEVKSSFVGNDIARYLSERENRVEALGETLDAEEEDETADDWRKAARDIASWSRDYFEDLEDKYENEPAIRDLVTALGIAEHAHFSALAESELPEKRDLLRKRLDALTAKRDELDRKWSKLTSDDDKIDREFQKVVEEINDIFVKVIEDEERYQGSMKESLSTFASRYEDLAKEIASRVTEAAAAVFFKDPQVGEIAGKVSEIAVEHAGAMSSRWSDLDQRIATAKRLVQTERKIFIVFGDTREDVEDFLELYRESEVEKVFREAKSEADAFKDDEEALHDIAFGHVIWLNERYESAFEEFADEHEKIFFGPLGQEAIEELFEVRDSEAAMGVMRSHKIAEFLDRKYLSGDDAFTVDFDHLSDGHRDYLFNSILKPEIEKSLAEWRKFAKSREIAIEDVLEYRLDLIDDLK